MESLLPQYGSLIGLGYLLNILRSVIPTYINNINGYNDYQNGFDIFYDNFFYVDILQFAGLAMLFFSLAIFLNFSNRELNLVGFCFILTNLLFLHYVPSLISSYSAPLYNLIIGGNDSSYFPFLTWIIYPIIGYIFAYYLIQTPNKFAFYKKIMNATTIGLSIYLFGILFLNFPTGYESDSGYYHHNFSVNLFYSFFTLWWISVIYFLSNKFLNLKFPLLIESSKYTTQIYFIHFFLMGLLSLFLHNKVDLAVTLIYSVIIYLFSYLLAKHLKI